MSLSNTYGSLELVDLIVRNQNVLSLISLFSVDFLNELKFISHSRAYLLVGLVEVPVVLRVALVVIFVASLGALETLVRQPAAAVGPAGAWVKTRDTYFSFLQSSVRQKRFT